MAVICSSDIWYLLAIWVKVKLELIISSKISTRICISYPSAEKYLTPIGKRYFCIMIPLSSPDEDCFFYAPRGAVSVTAILMKVWRGDFSKLTCKGVSFQI